MALANLLSAPRIVFPKRNRDLARKHAWATAATPPLNMTKAIKN